eukprot:767696-Hanusia_phi.AAC.12
MTLSSFQKLVRPPYLPIFSAKSGCRMRKQGEGSRSSQRDQPALIGLLESFRVSLAPELVESPCQTLRQLVVKGARLQEVLEVLQDTRDYLAEPPDPQVLAQHLVLGHGVVHEAKTLPGQKILEQVDDLALDLARPPYGMTSAHKGAGPEGDEPQVIHRTPHLIRHSGKEVVDFAGSREDRHDQPRVLLDVNVSLLLLLLLRCRQVPRLQLADEGGEVFGNAIAETKVLAVHGVDGLARGGHHEIAVDDETKSVASHGEVGENVSLLVTLLRRHLVHERDGELETDVLEALSYMGLEDEPILARLLVVDDLCKVDQPEALLLPSLSTHPPDAHRAVLGPGVLYLHHPQLPQEEEDRRVQFLDAGLDLLPPTARDGQHNLRPSTSSPPSRRSDGSRDDVLHALALLLLRRLCRELEVEVVGVNLRPAADLEDALEPDALVSYEALPVGLAALTDGADRLHVPLAETNFVVVELYQPFLEANNQSRDLIPRVRVVVTVLYDLKPSHKSTSSS